MDSTILSLFCKTEDEIPSNTWGENGNPFLPPESYNGNVEYKLKLINPSETRLEHLTTQMNFRLREGKGSCTYFLGVSDDGECKGIPRKEMEASISALRQMSTKIHATVEVLRETTVSLPNLEPDRTIVEVLVRAVPEDQPNDELRVCFVGNENAGKSTLLGVLSSRELDNGRGRARIIMFRHLHELKTGKTSSTSHEFLKFDKNGNHTESSPFKSVQLIDLAGNSKYFRTTVRGLYTWSPHYIICVVSCVTGLTKTSKDHIKIALTMKTPLIVVITKIDVANERQKLHTIVSLKEFLTSAKKEVSIISFDEDMITPNHLTIPVIRVSSVTGQGIDYLRRLLFMAPGLTPTDKGELEKKSPEFQIESCLVRNSDRIVFNGLVNQGMVYEGSELLLGPLEDGSFEPVTVNSIQRNRVPCLTVKGNQAASLGVTGVTSKDYSKMIRKGMYLLSPEIIPTRCLYFQASVRVIHHAKSGIKKGFETLIHIGVMCETGVVHSIRPVPRLGTNEAGTVIFQLKNPITTPSLGAPLLFHAGNTARGTGTVTRVFHGYDVPSED